MRSLLRPAVGTLLAAALVVTAQAVAPALAQTPATGVSVTIQPPGGAAPTTISTADIPNGDMNTTYRVGSQRVVVQRGVSVLQLLAKANADFDYAEIGIVRPDGTTLMLSKDQVEDVKPPGFYTDDQGVTRFIGPTGSNGAVAAQDYFAVGAAVTLTQQRAAKLEVAIYPSKRKIAKGGSLDFEADVTGDDAHKPLTYTWWLEGKPQKEGGSRFTQKFPNKDGVYKFSVAVRVKGSSVSTTAVAKITVGNPKKADEEQVGDGDGDGGATGGGSTSTGSGSYDDGSTGGGSGYSPSYTPAPTPAAPPAPPTPEPPAPDVATSGTTVEGNLLADVSDPPPSNILESAARAAQEGKQADDQGPDGAGVSEAALSIAGVLALLALGATIETRQGRRLRLGRPRLPLPRRAG